MLELMARLGMFRRLTPERWEERRTRGIFTRVWIPVFCCALAVGLGSAVIWRALEGMPLTSLITRAGARELVIRISLALALFVSLFYGEWRYYEQRRLRRRTEHAEPE